jgi:hypothetical protein
MRKNFIKIAAASFYLVSESYATQKRLPMNSSVKGREKNRMKEAPCQQRAVEFFLFLEKDRNTIYQDFRRQVAFQISTCIFASECAGRDE